MLIITHVQDKAEDNKDNPQLYWLLSQQIRQFLRYSPINPHKFTRNYNAKIAYKITTYILETFCCHFESVKLYVTYNVTNNDTSG